jgi:hypothetical protein
MAQNSDFGLVNMLYYHGATYILSEIVLMTDESPPIIANYSFSFKDFVDYESIRIIRYCINGFMSIHKKRDYILEKIT